MYYKWAMRKVQKIAWQTQAAWKRLASIFKDKWSIDDYPIRVRFQATDWTSECVPSEIDSMDS